MANYLCIGFVPGGKLSLEEVVEGILSKGTFLLLFWQARRRTSKYQSGQKRYMYDRYFAQINKCKHYMLATCRKYLKFFFMAPTCVSFPNMRADTCPCKRYMHEILGLGISKC